MQKLVFLFLLLVSFCSFGQNDLKVNCIQVNTDGSAIIRWSYAGSQATFYNYKIYRKTSLTGTSIPLTTITNYATNSYIDTDSEATTKPCLYVVEVTLSTPEVEKDSMSTVFLTASATGVLGDEVLLSYKSLLPLSGTYNVYEIIQNSGGTWTDSFIGTSTTDLYIDKRTHPKCEYIYYKVESSSSVCNIISNRAEVVLQDGVKPDMPLFDSVSVDVLSQQIVLGWQPSVDNDVIAYLILKSEFPNGAFLPIDTVWGRTVTRYTWANGNLNEIYYFKIASIDNCYNTSLVSEAQVNMTLKVSSENCSNTVNLSWNQYINIPSGLAKYILYAKVDNDTYSPVGNIDSKQTQFSYTVPVGTLNVCFFIQAVGLDSKYTASSRVACFNFENPEIAKFIYLRSVSVNPNNTGVTLNLYVDATYTASGYDLYRYTESDSPEKVAKIPYTGNNNVSYTDTRITPNKQPYFYYVSVNDACDLITKSSNTVKTICTHLVNENKSSNKLSWNIYLGWQVVEGYEVYRQEGDDGPPMLLAYLPFFDTVFIDNQNIASANQSLNYYVVAIESSGNPYGFKDQARSSQVSYSQQGEVFVPSAFTPKGTGVNRIFKPILFFVNKGGYHLQIFNRWGVLLFETTNPDEGWDGVSKGQYLPIGAYIYTLKCTLSSGQEFSKHGTINLVE